MIRTGTVIKKESQGILVRFDQLAACVGCSGCGREQKTATLFLHSAAEIGDRISVLMPDAKILKASMVTYLIPLIGFIIGIALGNYFSQGSDLLIAAGSFIGLLTGLLILKLIDNHLGSKLSWKPSIVAINPEIEQEETFICSQMKNES